MHFTTAFTMPIRLCMPIYNIIFKLYSARAYVVLYNALSAYDYSFLYNEMFVDATAEKFNFLLPKSQVFYYSFWVHHEI
jgi:hypothetical protein